ncbi:MAG: hypothetical protein R2716_04795 [Microthrixaceae bacterium]
MASAVLGDREGAGGAPRPASRSGRTSHSSRPTTRTSCSAGSRARGVRFLGASDHHLAVDPPRHLEGVGRQDRGPRPLAGGGRELLSPSIPATTPAPFPAERDVRVVPVNDLAALEAGRQLRGRGSRQDRDRRRRLPALQRRGPRPDHLDPTREPWMLDRAVVQPDPVVALGLAADTMDAAAAADSPEDMFLRLEDAGVMLRIDRDVVPTMAKTPTLGAWELRAAGAGGGRRAPRPRPRGHLHAGRL